MSAQSILRGPEVEARIHGEVVVHRAFERQVERTPDAIAVRLGGDSLSYAQLDERANRLANHLRAKAGVGLESLVGIFFEPSLELVVSVLAVLKAGGAYLPLDPLYPPQRLQYMVTDSRVSIVLTHQRLKSAADALGARQLLVDLEWPAIETQPSVSAGVGVGPQNLAYVIYTSGSTGAPKGTLIEHGGVINYLHWSVAQYALRDGVGAPVHSSLSFDLTVTSLWGPLVAGGVSELLPASLGVAGLLDTIKAQRNYSLIKLTPLHLDQLRQQADPARLDGWAHCFVIGGENLLSKELSFWQRHAPRTRLINEYGPTETVVGCCVHTVDSGVHYGHAVPIGLPIQNTTLYVLDAQLRPVADGAEGELFIGGAGVARGYLNRPDLSAWRFIADPLAGRLGARMYRTGDRVRRLADGSLEFLGRFDEQVKVKGHRVELGEVEAVVALHAQVAEVVALVVGAGADAKLIVVVVPRGEPPKLLPLKLFCSERMPRYMVPDKVHVVAELPSTVNGKVDREALKRKLLADLSA